MEISNEQVCSAITRFIRKEVKKRNARVVVVGISGGIDKVGTPEREMPHSSELTLFIQASPKRLHVSLLTANELLTLLFP